MKKAPIAAPQKTLEEVMKPAKTGPVTTPIQPTPDAPTETPGF